MMKKFALVSMAAALSMVLIGCSVTTFDLVEENLSEYTQTYYFAENEDFYCTLSSGKREREYLMNGKSEDCVDFALLSLILNGDLQGKVIKAKIVVDGVEEEQELEVNSLNNAYMVDLERNLSGEEKIEVLFGDKRLQLQNVSKNFGVDSKKALEIAVGQLEDKILAQKRYNELNSECYLRVLDKKANSFDDLFWCFTVLDIEGRSSSVIISTVDGSVLAKSN